jgi:uncharacterized protein YbjT (DUF2867 family)
VTDVVVKVLAEKPKLHHGATYELCSGECLTAGEIAARLSRVLGRTVETVWIMLEDVIESVFGEDSNRVRFAERVRLFTRVADWYSDRDFDGSVCPAGKGTYGAR